MEATPLCPRMDERISETWCWEVSDGVSLDLKGKGTRAHATPWMDLGDVVLSGTGWPQEDECGAVPLVRGAQSAQSAETESGSVAARGWVGGGMESRLVGAGLQFCREKSSKAKGDAVSAPHR